MTASLKDTLFVATQYLTPHHALSRLTGWFAESEFGPIRDTFIRRFARHFEVDMTEAERPELSQYRNFNDFFTRALKPGARPLPEDSKALACPVDGTVSQAGRVESGRIFQAKGRSFTATELLGGDSEQARRYQDGHFATLYLSPKDYHRIHMPCDGTLVRTTFVPGRLFSVNAVTTDRVPRLFARNERLVCEFDTERGRMVLVLVGAMIVASIETTWAGVVAPYQRDIIQHRFDEPALRLERGEEMGRFRLGSTVVMLFEKEAVQWADGIAAGARVRLGQSME
ncbi:archaetidylserine decarboxylase [Saccharospirillum salsuginis]|uniref:Phosphatidylserine decarboxylase proenzyme n=1 Tax=Saccharospirillum salsuginis TaxID=418750 RepID=A0A918K337_9GAMM|nr:archaetidylserine decarboxylase [Saccharospirillum salsuginis]GGX45972.1 phosphatidylserine decarboxylase proenzyme [Saccharospirillum salsuginis]